MRRTILAYAAIVLATAALGGCREEEQGRPLILEKGNYAGRPDTTLSKAQLDELTSRAMLQGQSSGSGPAPGSAAQDDGPREVKEKVPDKVQDNSPPLPEAVLNDRLKMQSGQ